MTEEVRRPTAAFLTTDWSFGLQPIQPNGCAHYRCKLPMDELQKDYNWVCGLGLPGLNQSKGIGLLIEDDKAIHGWDLIILKLIMHKTFADFMPIAKELGQKIIVDIDDWFDGLEPTNRAFETTDPKKNPEVNRGHYAKIIEQADALIVSTPFLLDYYKQFHKNVFMVRNGIDLDRWVKRKVRDTWNPTIGWVGATPWRSNDLEVLGPKFGKYIQKNKLKFHHSGHTDNAPLAHELAGVHVMHCSVSHMLPISDYPKLFKHIDIGLVPLSPVKFNDAKSYIKGLEYAAAGVPFIASPSPEYLELAKAGIGRIAHNWEDWEYHFNELRDSQKRIDDAEINLENLKNFTVKARASEWDSTLKFILDSM
jgi:glycosyltransferase involved in cell wall biosynthesis